MVLRPWVDTALACTVAQANNASSMTVDWLMTPQVPEVAVECS